MTLINCPACNEQISEMAFDCPKCGHSLKKPKRTLFGKITKWFFILFNIIMLLWIIGGVGGGNEAVNNAASDAEAAGVAIGTALGATMLIFIWVIGDIILGMFVLFTRPKK